MDKYLFTIQNVETGKLNALVNNIMKQTGVDDPNEAIRLVNSGEWTLTGPVRTWTEKDGIIYFSVTSKDSDGDPGLLSAGRGDGGSWLFMRIVIALIASGIVVMGLLSLFRKFLALSLLTL